MAAFLFSLVGIPIHHQKGFYTKVRKKNIPVMIHDEYSLCSVEYKYKRRIFGNKLKLIKNLTFENHHGSFFTYQTNFQN